MLLLRVVKMNTNLGIGLKGHFVSHIRAQFHQRSTCSFYNRRSQKHKKDSQVVNLFFTLLGSTSIKAAHKMLVKLTPGVDFTKVLRAVFANKYSKSPKRHWSLDCLSVLLGSLQVKAGRKILMKLTLRNERECRSGCQHVRYEKLYRNDSVAAVAVYCVKWIK